MSYCRVKKEVSLEDWKSLKISGKCSFGVSPGSRAIIGRNVVINTGDATISPSPTKIFVTGGGILQIGNHTGLSSTVIVCKDKIRIGNYVNIGAGCMILDTDMHSVDWRQRAYGQDSINANKAPVIIEDHVFIGAKSIVLKGVTIGEKSIISAGSVVIKNIPANCLAGGNPCKVIKQLEL